MGRTISDVYPPSVSLLLSRVLVVGIEIIHRTERIVRFLKDNYCRMDLNGVPQTSLEGG